MLLYSRTGQSFRVFLTQDLCRQNIVTEAFKLTPGSQKWYPTSVLLCLIHNVIYQVNHLLYVLTKAEQYGDI